MAISIYLNGTNGITDGTVAEQGNGITLAAIDMIVTVHLRSPAGHENAEAVTVPAPIDCQVSADGSTWGETTVYPIGAIGDTNTPLHFRRVANTVNTYDDTPYSTGIATNPRAAFVTTVAV